MFLCFTIFFHKITLGVLSSYLQEYRNSYSTEGTYSSRSSIQKKTKTFSARTKSLETSSFHTALKNGANLARKFEIYIITKFKSSVLNFIRPRENLPVITLLTNDFPICLLTGNLPVMILLTGNLLIMILLTGNLLILVMSNFPVMVLC